MLRRWAVALMLVPLVILQSWHSTMAVAETTTGRSGGEPLKVVFVGKYRSGSTSLSVALERLGYKACHGVHIIENIDGSHAQLAEALMEHDVDHILQATSDLGCNATMEMHAIFWKEIVRKVSNDTKIIVIRRDFQPWLKSVKFLFAGLAPIHRYPLKLIPRIAKVSHLLARLTQYEGGLASIEEALIAITHPGTERFAAGLERIYQEFDQDVLELLRTKPQQTLLFDMKQGYPVLCDFLNIPANKCPQEKYPHVLGARQLRMKQLQVHIKEKTIHGSIFAIVVIALLQIFKRLRLGKRYNTNVKLD